MAKKEFEYYVSLSRSTSKVLRQSTVDVTIPNNFALYFNPDYEGEGEFYAFMLNESTAVFTNDHLDEPSDFEWQIVALTRLGMAESDMAVKGFEKVADLKLYAKGYKVVNSAPDVKHLIDMKRLFPSA